MSARSGRRGKPATWGRQLVIMARAPVAGRVKSRLARDVGIVRATQFYRHATAAVIARLAAGRGWRTTLALTPDHGGVPALWLRQAGSARQGSGDLGQRMQRIMDKARPGPVIIVGTDIPAIRACDVAAAFAALGRADAVLGPAGDGGYWLVGLKRVPKVLRIFGCVRWSSAHALADTKANLTGRKVADARTLSDVDGGADLTRERGRHGRIIRPAVTCSAEQTTPPGPVHLPADSWRPLA